MHTNRKELIVEQREVGSLRLVTNEILLFIESTVELGLERGGIRLLVGGRRGSLRLRRSWQ